MRKQFTLLPFVWLAQVGKWSNVCNRCPARRFTSLQSLPASCRSIVFGDECECMRLNMAMNTLSFIARICEPKVHISSMSGFKGWLVFTTLRFDCGNCIRPNQRSRVLEQPNFWSAFVSLGLCFSLFLKLSGNINLVAFASFNQTPIIVDKDLRLRYYAPLDPPQEFQLQECQLF